MDRLGMKGGLCLAAFAMLAAQPATASAKCWDQNHAAAAKVRDLQSRLMVATMRCRAYGVDVLPQYNDFVRTNRETIQDANGLIKAQFSDESGYDSYTTTLANAYGADRTNDQVCEETAEIASDAVAAGGNIDRLLDIADRAGVKPDLPGGACPISFASSN